MESSLLCASSCIIYSQNLDKVGAFGRNYQSSFCGKALYKNSLLTRSTGNVSTRRAIITSVLGKKVKEEVIIPDPDYRLSVVLLGMAGSFVYVDNLSAAVPIGLLGLLLLVQFENIAFHSG